MATWKKVVVSGSAISQLQNDRQYLSATGTGILSASAAGTSQGQIKLNGVDVAVTGLSTTSKPTFAAVTASLKGNVIGNVTGNLNGNVTGDLTGTSSFATIAGGLVASALTNAMVDANAAIEYTKLDFDGSGFISSSGQLGVNDTVIALTGSNGVTINGGATADFTTNQASSEGFTISIPAGTVSASADGANQGEVRINGIARSTGLKTTDSVTFATASVTNNLSVGGNIAIVGNLGVGGDLTVQGSVSSLQTTNVNVEDQFILLNSGSAAADGGLVVNGAGAAIGWDQSEGRWALDAAGATWNQTSIDSDAFVASVITSAASTGSYAKAGNIWVDGSDIFIYV
jgi:trimeric autotransporter adhesin